MVLILLKKNMNIEQIASELCEQFQNGASVSDVIDIIGRLIIAEREACKNIASEYGMRSGIGDDGIAAADAIVQAISIRSNW